MMKLDTYSPTPALTYFGGRYLTAVSLSSATDSKIHEKLITSEIATALDEVADGSRPKASRESRGSFFRDNKTPSGKEAVACKCAVYLEIFGHAF